MDLNKLFNSKEVEEDFENGKGILVSLVLGALKGDCAKSYIEDGERKISVIVRSEVYDLQNFIDCSQEDEMDIAQRLISKDVKGFRHLEFKGWNNGLEVVFVLEDKAAGAVEDMIKYA